MARDFYIKKKNVVQGKDFARHLSQLELGHFSELPLAFLSQLRENT